MERMNPDEQHRLLEEIRRINSLTETIADLSLKTAEINVEISGCELAELRLNSEFADILKRLKLAITPLISVCLGLKYNQINQQFYPTNIKYNFNNCILEFAQSPRLKEDYDAYYFQILDPSGDKLIIKKNKTFLIPSLKAYEMLRKSGVWLPQEPQPADWSEIDKILQFSSSWRTSAQTTSILDERTTFFIRDHRVGKNNTFEHDGYAREIILAEQFSSSACVPPSSAAEFTFRSYDHSTPTLTSVSMVPLQYRIIDNVESPVRHTIESERKEIELTREGLLNYIGVIDDYYQALILGNN